ncbi:MAG: hypothetical protein N2322_02700, partial [Terrimicrobiaceae bacterium]|nr:hypothetical protein [Terrimicrobiaceae bacterium]
DVYKRQAVRLGWLLAATGFCLAAAGVRGGSEDRSGFLFELQSAFRTRDYEALAGCFEFEGARPATRRAVEKVLQQIMRWKGTWMKITERSGSGPFQMLKEGKPHRFNGEWEFQVHLHDGPPPSRGFVFPAGRTREGRYAILLAVPASEL